MGSKLKSREELRKQWEEFKKKQVGRREGWHCWARLPCAPPLPSFPSLRRYDLSFTAKQRGGAIGYAAYYEYGSTQSCAPAALACRRPQEADRNAQLSNHRGLYVCRMDLSDMPAHLGLAGLFRSSGSGSGGRPGAIAQQLHEQVIRPLFRSVTVTNSIDTPVGTDGDVFYMQGQAALRGNAGAGGARYCGDGGVMSVCAATAS